MKVSVYVHVITRLRVENQGGLLEVGADPKTCGLFDASTTKLTIIHFRKGDDLLERP